MKENCENCRITNVNMTESGSNTYMEKLILHVLFILLPVHIYSVFLENRKAGQSPYILGIVNSLCAILTMSFSISAFSLYWDLRYIPLVITIFYYGPISGFIVFLTILIERMIIGGEGVWIAYICLIVAVLFPMYIRKKFNHSSRRKKIFLAAISGILIAIGQLVITYTYLYFHYGQQLNGIKLFFIVLVYGVIQTFGILISTLLHEKILEKKLLQQEIIRAEKLNTMGEMAASIAHEIRNPLTVVKGFLQLMQKQEKNDNLQYLTLILSELARAELIINDYLNFAKPQYKKVEEIQLGDTLFHVVTLIESLALKNGVKLEFYGEKNPIILADRNHLIQAFINLIKNAIEATPNKGSVVVKIDEDNDYIYIKILDTGKGMSKEQLSKIGTLYYTTKDKGTGIGTTVSLKFIEEMKGKVTYQSTPNVGTEVTILFPRIKK